ncbi:MAG: hypothetical protein ACHQIH_00320 [Ignavibacteria bacterium]
MYNSVLVRILKTFSESEFRKFDKLVNSPYFNTSEATIKCFSAIKEYYPSFNDMRLTKETVFSRIHPGRKFDDTLIRKYISNLIKLMDEYLTLNTFNRKKRIKKRFLLEELRLRKLNSYYERKLRDSEGDFSHDAVVDREYFIDRYFHEHEKIYHYVSVNKQIRIPSNVLKRSNFLVYFFFQELVHNKLDIRVNERQFNFKTDNILINNIYSNIKLDDIMSKLNESPFENDFLQMYFYLGKMLFQYDTSASMVSGKLFQSLIKLLDFDLKNLIFAILESYYIYRINNEGDSDNNLSSELFNIYELMLSENIFLYPDNNFKMAEFRNVLMSSLKLKKTEWAMEFIKTYSGYLEENIRIDTINYSRAKIHSVAGQHEEVLQYLSRIKHEDFLYQLDIKNMLMQAYYKLDMFEQAFSLIDTYKKLLRNSKNLAEHRKKFNYTFINYYTKLLKIKLGNDKGQSIAVLKSKIQNESKIMSREWLINELGALENQER